MPSTPQDAVIAFLHTSAVHIETFNALGREIAPGVKLTHAVREDLLCAAEKAGVVTQALDIKTQEALIALAEGRADAVVCTCSTLGASAEAASFEASVPILRIDRAMADLAVRTGAVIGVCACLPSSVANTNLLIQGSAARAGRKVDIRNFIFDDVWTAFCEGRLDDYYAGIAARMEEAARDVDVLVLAQASMAPAASLCGGLRVPVLSSPRIGFEAAVQFVRAPLVRRIGS